MPPLVSYTEIDTPLGKLTLMKSEWGLCLLKYGSPKDVFPKTESWRKRYFSKNVIYQENKHAFLQETEQLREYFQGNRHHFTVQLDIKGTAFQRKVWRALLRIPYGETKTYQQIAYEVQSPKAVRAVGMANHQNPIAIMIPCHRVIGKNGKLTGYGGGLDKKEKLIHLEQPK
ncbi:methylated-DNA--[protein]-cysteine S-methyltransferase [Aliibacillus thermotolerans]|uniref:Methylated-DNA--protein-cysteine methyltransferase n=1 Tax=Aliibacillus thermotolerans TaxID=1834418 RepID=A0ABW0U7G4_9BACI|nr:methylated-DNA--[protein]-cysteine S-methyltransferase [Aliibacillus thermotolerans]MDA3128544.1 methylated-DNA--[protein]-cysteine S-methyltransferase [Aliibacillus thermotolerans]